jgi:enoyl-CoA hydratase
MSEPSAATPSAATPSGATPPGAEPSAADAPTVVDVSDHGAVRVVRLDRPAARNALSIDLVRELHAALTAADADPAVRVIVLTGTDPAFCAGVDLKQAATRGAEYFAVFSETDAVRLVADLTTPIVGAVNGAAFTGGLELALGCDFLVASERAVFADTHLRVGVLPGGGMTAHLPQAVGVPKARRMSLTGEVVDAAEALRIGLVTEVVAHDALLPRALELAQAIAELPDGMATGVKGIYREGAGAVATQARIVETRIASAQQMDVGALEERRLAVTARNRAQIG